MVLALKQQEEGKIITPKILFEALIKQEVDGLIK